VSLSNSEPTGVHVLRGLYQPMNLNARGRERRGPEAAEKPAPLAYAIIVAVKRPGVGLKKKKKKKIKILNQK